MAVIGVLILYAGALVFADGIRIKECSNGQWLDIREDNNPSTPITCDEFSANDTITWTLSVSGTVTGNYTCGPGSQQCVSTDSDVTISRTNQSKEESSVLTVVGNHRTKAGKGIVTCRLAGQTSVSIAQCNTNVVSPAIVSQCQLTINTKDWTASASCQYDRVYSSNGTYNCTWYRQLTGESSRYRLLSVNLPTTNQTTTGSKQYYKGDCSLPRSLLPVAEGTHIYTVDFIPGPDRFPVGSVTIQKPGNPQTNCTHYVYEGQDVQCSCLANSSAPGSPAPVVQWQGLQPGEALNIGQVFRNDTGREFSCQLNWGLPNNKPRKTTKYTLKVAYGPDEVMITEDEGAQSSPPSSTLTLQCRAINVFPSATFTWSGVNCSSTTFHTPTSTCTFPWTPGDDKTTVTCTARNSQFPQRFPSQTTDRFPAEHPTSPTTSGITSSATGSPTSAHTGNPAAHPTSPTTSGITSSATGSPTSAHAGNSGYPAAHPTSPTTSVLTSSATGSPTSAHAGNSGYPAAHPTTPTTSVLTSSATGSPTSAHAGNPAAPGGDGGFPLGVVIGVVIGAVVLAVIVIIIVAIIVKRKRRRTPKDHDNESAKVVTTANSDEFEEHTNPVYGTEEEADRSSTANPKPSAVALRISADSSVPPSAPAPAINPSSAAPVRHSSRAVSPAGPYSSVDEDGIVPVRNGLDVDEGLGDYAVVGDPHLQPPEAALSGPAAPAPAINPSSATPVRHSSRAVSPDGPYSSVDEDGIVPARNELDADEGLGDYAVVGDPHLQPPEASLSGPAAVEEDEDSYAVIPTGSKSPSTSTDAPPGYIYSVVNKPKAEATSSSPSNTTQPSDDIPKEDENAYSVVDLNPTSPSPSSAQADDSNNVYAQVNKSAKRGHNLPSDQPNTEAIRKPQSSAKPETKPKPDIKPKPKPDGNAAEGRKLEDEQHGDQPTSPDYQAVEPSQQAVNPPKEVTQNASSDDDYSTLNSVFQRSYKPEAGGPEDSPYSHFSDFR